jgi:hypothetical protein
MGPDTRRRKIVDLSEAAEGGGDGKDAQLRAAVNMLQQMQKGRQALS